MPWQVVIAGGGFAGFYAARALECLPPAHRARVTRLLAHWNVALVFGRDPSSPGRLGNPTPLEPE